MTDKILTFILCLQVTVVLSQNVTIHGNCSGVVDDTPLHVWGVTRNSLTCMQLDLPRCTSSALPLQVGGKFMGKPYSMKTEGVLIPGPNASLIPQLVVTWQPPRAEAGFEHLKGFSVEVWKMNEVAGKDFTCMVFDFSGSNFTTEDYQLTFQKKFLQFDGGQDNIYRLDLYTLPRSPDSIPKRAVFTLQSQIVGNDTADWTSSISYDVETLTAPATITIHFSLAPPYYGFKSYYVYLVDKADPWNAAAYCYVYLDHDYMCQGQKNNPPPKDATTATLSFSDIMEGVYSVRIQPEDPDRQNDNCLCYRGYHEGDDSKKRNCKPCLHTNTDYVFIVAGKGKPAASPSTPDSASSHLATTEGPEPSSTSDQSSITASIRSSVSRPNSGMDKSVIAVVAILGILLGLIAVVVVVIFLRRHRSSSESIFIKNSLQHNGVLSPSTQRKKTVYLLYTSDHKEHVNVVTKFAIYLTNRCSCQVFFIPWFRGEIQNMGCYQWVISHIDRSDYVIIINSEAAFNLFDARNTNTSFQIDDQGPEVDMFSLAVTHVMTKSGQQDFYKKTILTYFEYTDDEFVLKDISPGVQYKVPKHLKELLCHIHEIDMYTVDPKKLEVESMDNITSHEGRDLQESITKAKHFEKSNPNWFHERYHLQQSDSFQRLEYDQGRAESVSMSPAVYTVQTAYFQIGEDDDARSAITYDTNYINTHPEERSIIPPSDVTMTTARTDFINTQLHHINLQQSMENNHYRNHAAFGGYVNYSCSDADEVFYPPGDTQVNSYTGERNYCVHDTDVTDHMDHTANYVNGVGTVGNAQERYNLSEEDLLDGRDV